MEKASSASSTWMAMERTARPWAAEKERQAEELKVGMAAEVRFSAAAMEGE